MTSPDVGKKRKKNGKMSVKNLKIQRSFLRNLKIILDKK